MVSVHAHGICHMLSRRSVVCMSNGSEYECHQKRHLTFGIWHGPSHYLILCIDSNEVYGGWRRGKWQLHFLFQLILTGVSDSSSCVSCRLLNWCHDLHLACFVIGREYEFCCTRQSTFELGFISQHLMHIFQHALTWHDRTLSVHTKHNLKMSHVVLDSSNSCSQRYTARWTRTRSIM